MGRNDWKEEERIGKRRRTELKRRRKIRTEDIIVIV